MMKRLFILIFIFSTFTLEAYTWTLDRNVLEEKLPLGLKIEELTSVLEKEGITVQFKADQNLTLWKKNNISISISPSPFSPYHLWISVEGKKTLDECTKNELLELYQSIWKARRALVDILEADSFMIFMTEEMRNGKGNSFVGVEMIPSGLGGSNGVMDAKEKDSLNEYVFYNYFSAKPVIHSTEKIEAIREKLQIVQPFIQEELSQKLWSQKLLNYKEALYHNLQYIYDDLKKTGSLIEGDMPPLPVITKDEIHEIHINLDKCAFCNPKVIEKQIVCEWKDLYIIMSHKPLSLYGNFLILPKRHQCAWDLTQEEAIASFEAIIALKKMLLKTSGSNHWICYIQDGLAVGQTVPHTHIHCFLLPEHLKLTVTALQHIHNERPVLTYEEMRAECNRIKPLLLDHL